MAYIDCEYKDSIAYNSVMSISRGDGLLYRMTMTKNAIHYHTKEGNAGQIKFFQDELNLINKRLKLKRFNDPQIINIIETKNIN